MNTKNSKCSQTSNINGLRQFTTSKSIGIIQFVISSSYILSIVHKLYAYTISIESSLLYKLRKCLTISSNACSINVSGNLKMGMSCQFPMIIILSVIDKKRTHEVCHTTIALNCFSAFMLIASNTCQK